MPRGEIPRLTYTLFALANITMMGLSGQSSSRIAQLVSASGVVMARRGQPTRLRHGTTTTKPKAAPTRSLLPTKPKAAQQRRSRPRGHRHKELELVLNTVSFDVAAGQKVGVCGRTGSGKSSL